MSNEQVVWKPIESGRIPCACGDEDCGKHVRIESPAREEDGLYTFWYCPGKYEDMMFLPKDYAICKETTVPAAASVPVDEIAKLLDYGTDKESLNEYEWHCYKESRRVVFDWLSTVTQE